MNFEVSGQASDSTVDIAGIPIESGLPSDGQVIAYSAAAKQWQYETLPISNFYCASGAASFSPIAGTDIPLAADGVVNGTDIVRLSPTTFALQPGTYSLQFQIVKVDFGAAGATEQVTYQFYDATSASTFGPVGEASGFDGGTTVVCGVYIETVVRLTVQSNISVRTTAVSGTAPTLTDPYLIIARLN